MVEVRSRSWTRPDWEHPKASVSLGTHLQRKTFMALGRIDVGMPGRDHSLCFHRPHHRPLGGTARPFLK